MYLHSLMKVVNVIATTRTDPKGHANSDRSSVRQVSIIIRMISEVELEVGSLGMDPM
jgi:hypothetical protein